MSNIILAMCSLAIADAISPGYWEEHTWFLVVMLTVAIGLDAAGWYRVQRVRRVQ